MSCFLQHPKIAGIVTALHPQDQRWSGLSISADKPVHTVTGGETRTQSVHNALHKLLEMAAKEDFVLVHDAARPCLRYADLDLLIQTFQRDEIGGILAAPVGDTIKQVSRVGKSIAIDKTIDRAHLWRALTPQMFRISVLQEALDYCLAHNVIVTDEASAVEAMGLGVKLVEGHSDNIKITRPEDINLAISIMQNLTDALTDRDDV